MELLWTVQPVVSEPAKGISAAVLIMAVLWFAFHWGGLAIGFLAVLLLVGGTGPFYVRTRYRLTPERVEVRSLFQKTARPWTYFKRAYVGTRGVSLSPFSRKHFLEPYRSVMLRYGDRREDVLSWVERFGPDRAGKAS